MLNLFAYRTTFPTFLKKASEPIGDENDRWIASITENAMEIVAAWGTQGCHMDRDIFVSNELAKLGRVVKCLGVTKDGHPKHPPYLLQNISLQNFTPRSIVKKGTER